MCMYACYGYGMFADSVLRHDGLDIAKVGSVVG